MPFICHNMMLERIYLLAIQEHDNLNQLNTFLVLPHIMVNVFVAVDFGIWFFFFVVVFFGLGFFGTFLPCNTSCV